MKDEVKELKDEELEQVSGGGERLQNMAEDMLAGKLTGLVVTAQANPRMVVVDAEVQNLPDET